MVVKSHMIKPKKVDNLSLTNRLRKSKAKVKNMSIQRDAEVQVQENHEKMRSTQL